MFDRNDEGVRRLQSIQLFATCTRAQLRRIRSLSTEVAVRAGRELAVEGRRCRELIVILEGEARASSDRQVVGMLGPGDYLGESSLRPNTVSPLTIVTTTDARVLAFERRELLSLFATAAPDALCSLLGSIREFPPAQSEVAAA